MSNVCFFFSEKCQKHHTESIYGGEKSADQRREIEPDISFFTSPCQPQDLIFTVKTCSNKRQRSQRSGADKKSPIDNRQFFSQATHFKHVVFMVQDHNNCSCREEEQGLKECMDHKMENRGRPCSYTQGEEHVSNLANS